MPPLAVPTEGSQDAEDPLQYSAVRLFIIIADNLVNIGHAMAKQAVS